MHKSHADKGGGGQRERENRLEDNIARKGGLHITISSLSVINEVTAALTRELALM